MSRRAKPGSEGARRALVALVGALIVGAVALGVWRWRAAEEAERAAEDARGAEREARRAQRERRLHEESERLMPSVVSGVHLGMPLAEAREARRMTPDLNARAEEGTAVFEERLPNGSRVMYVFDRRDRLQRVQVLSMIPPEGVGPHLSAMNAQYGTPTGVWDCPSTGGVPTRRFTWRHGETTVSDIFLVHANQVSVTLYIAPSAVIERSLRMGACRPIASADELDVFPVARPEDLAGARP